MTDESDMTTDQPVETPSRRDRVRVAVRRAAPYVAGAIGVGGVVAVAVAARNAALPLTAAPDLLKLPSPDGPTSALRSSPVRHVVREHERNGSTIPEYWRGVGAAA